MLINFIFKSCTFIFTLLFASIITILVLLYDCEDCDTWKIMVIQLIIGSVVTISIFIGQYKITQTEQQYVEEQRQRETQIINPLITELGAIMDHYITLDKTYTPCKYYNGDMIRRLNMADNDISDYVKYSSSNMNIKLLKNLDSVRSYIKSALKNKECDEPQFMNDVRSIQKIIEKMLFDNQHKNMS